MWLQAPLQIRRAGVAATEPARQIVAHQLGHRHADVQQLRRIVEAFGIAPVPGHQPQLGIDHADALAHVLQRGLEHALVEAQRLRGLADDVGDGVQVAAGVRRAASTSRRALAAPSTGASSRSTRAMRSAPACVSAPSNSAALWLSGRKREASSRSTAALDATGLGRCRRPAPRRASSQHRQRGRNQADAGAARKPVDAAEAAKFAGASRSSTPGKCGARWPASSAASGSRMIQNHSPMPTSKPPDTARAGVCGRYTAATIGGASSRQRRERQGTDVGQRFARQHRAAVGPGQQHDQQRSRSGAARSTAPRRSPDAAAGAAHHAAARASGWRS